MSHLCCEKDLCNKHRACNLLGQCVFNHEFFINNNEGRRELECVTRLDDVLRVFHKHTTRRVVISSHRGRGNFIYPGSYHSARLQTKIDKGARKKALKEYKNSHPVTPALDPVTLRI